jgi:hypothetical protein
VSTRSTGAELHRQAELARRAQLETTREVISGLDMDVRILARELYGREGRDLDVAVRTVDRMTQTLATLRGHLVAELADPQAGQ